MAGASVANMGALVVAYYNTDDPTERDMLRIVMRRGIDIAGEAREDQAKRIIIELGNAMPKGNSGSRARARRRSGR